MKKKKLAIICLILVVCTMLQANVFASEHSTKGTNSPNIISTQSYDEVISYEQLKELAADQYTTVNCGRSNPVNAESDTLKVKQLLETRTYSDGTSESDYAVTSMILSSEDQAALAAARGVSLSTSNASSISGYSVYITLYFTLYSTSDTVYKYRVDRVTTTIVRTSSTSKTVSSASHAYLVTSTQGKSEGIYYSNNSTASSQSFTMYSSHTGYYPSMISLWQAQLDGIAAQANIRFSSGEVLSPATHAYYS